MNPVFIFIATQLPENLGGIARAMANFGLNEIRLVNPITSKNHPKAIATAVSAAPLLEKARVYTSLEEATQDLHFLFATTAVERYMVKPIYTPSEFSEWYANAVTNEKVGVLFGPESTGLTNEHIAHTCGVISISTAQTCSSLNIAQAVVIVAYEIFNLFKIGSDEKRCFHHDSPKASLNEVNFFLQTLEGHLDKRNFWKVPEKKETMWRNIRNIFNRNELSHQEVQTLNGLIRCLVSPKR